MASAMVPVPDRILLISLPSSLSRPLDERVGERVGWARVWDHAAKGQTKLTRVSDDNASWLVLSHTATEGLHLLLEVVVESEDVDLKTVEDVLVVAGHLVELVLHLGDVGAALDVHLGEVESLEGGEEVWGDSLEQELLEGHGGASGDENVTRHLRMIELDVIMEVTVDEADQVVQKTVCLTHLECFRLDAHI